VSIRKICGCRDKGIERQTFNLPGAVSFGTGDYLGAFGSIANGVTGAGASGFFGRQTMRIRAELHADDHGRPQLQAFHFDRRRIDVAETLDQWYGPDYRYVKVRACDGDTYILKFHETHSDWELTMFSRTYTRVRMV
jgi:hypothetical protein